MEGRGVFLWYPYCMKIWIHRHILCKIFGHRNYQVINMEIGAFRDSCYDCGLPKEEW